MLFDLTVQLPSVVGHMSMKNVWSSPSNVFQETGTYDGEGGALDTDATSRLWDLEFSSPMKRPSLLVLDTTKVLIAKMESRDVNSEEMQAVLVDLLNHVDAQDYNRNHTIRPDASTEFLKDVMRSKKRPKSITDIRMLMFTLAAIANHNL